VYVFLHRGANGNVSKEGSCERDAGSEKSAPIFFEVPGRLMLSQEKVNYFVLALTQ
jgi:hypothetical protein